MNRQRFFVGLAFAAVVAALLPGLPAHAARPDQGPDFAMPKRVTLEGPAGTTIRDTIVFTNKGDKKTGELHTVLDEDNPLFKMKSGCEGERIKPGKSCVIKISAYAMMPTEGYATVRVVGPTQKASTRVQAYFTGGSTNLMNVSPSSYSFGTLDEGTQILTFTNNTGGMFVGGFTVVVAPSNNGYTATDTDCDSVMFMNPGDECQVEISFVRNTLDAASVSVYLTKDDTAVSEASMLSSDAVL